MKKKCLITGATSGIGLAAIKKIAESDYDITFIGRSETRCKELVEELKNINPKNNYSYKLADFEDLESIRRVAYDLLAELPRLNILINNAGAVYAKRELTAEGYEKTFVTNHLSPFLLTNILLPLIENTPSARIINTASDSHYMGRLNFNDLHYSRIYFVMRAYERSKLANVLFSNHLAKLLQDKKVTVNSLHPGVVKTDIGKKNTNFVVAMFWKIFNNIAGVSVEQGADTIIYLATSPEVEGVTGKYFYKRKPKEPSKLAQDTVLAEQLWNESLRMVHL